MKQNVAKAFLIVIIIVTDVLAQGFRFDNFKYSKAQAVLDAQNSLQEIGHNCVEPHRLPLSVKEFVEETTRLIEGMNRLSLEMTLKMGSSVLYPSICNVFTQSQANEYKEEWLDIPKSKEVGSVGTQKLKVNYYWPKYQIEVTEIGSDFHDSYKLGNKMLLPSRIVAKKMASMYDISKINSIRNYLIADLPFLSSSPVLNPIQKLRITGSQSTDGASLEANAWPIVGSYTVASMLTVCGPSREELGFDPGGIKWPFKGVPMTCPIGTSEDIYPFWDSGYLDFLDPNSVKNILLSTDVKTCGADYVAKTIGDLASAKAENYIPYNSVQNAINEKYPSLRKSLLGCSFPLVGDVEAMSLKYAKTVSGQSWRELGCTPWGPLYPRTGRHTFHNDFIYANTALRYKLLLNDVMGINRGLSEKWSMAYPWDARSYQLHMAGSPLLIDTSLSPKHKADLAKNMSAQGTYSAQLSQMDSASALAVELGKRALEEGGVVDGTGGDRRIYTIWEKIVCPTPITVTTFKTPVGEAYKKYDSCKSAIRLSAYKNFQKNILRKMCDASGNFEGAPWK